MRSTQPDRWLRIRYVQQRVADYHGLPKSFANALLHVYTMDAIDPNDNLRELRPYSIVGLDNLEYTKVNTGCAHVNLANEGGVFVIIEDNARHTEGHDAQWESTYDFNNFFGGVLDDQNEVFQTDNDLYGFDTIELIERPMRADFGDRRSDDFWVAIAAFMFDRHKT